MMNFVRGSSSAETATKSKKGVGRRRVDSSNTFHVSLSLSLRSILSKSRTHETEGLLSSRMLL